MFWHLAAAAAAAYLFYASAAANTTGTFMVNILKPRLIDISSDQGTCCEASAPYKVQIYQAVLNERVEFQVYAQVVNGMPNSTNQYMSFVVKLGEKMVCFNERKKVKCWTRNNCSYICEPNHKVSPNGSECYEVIATSRAPTVARTLHICVYNRSAEPLYVLNHSAERDFDKRSLTLNYTVGGYPLPASVTVTCYEHADGRTTHQVDASVSFVQYNVGHYAFQLDNVTADEIQCQVSALGEFYSLTSAFDLINVTSAHEQDLAFTFGTATEQFVSHEVTAVTTNANTSIFMHSGYTTPSGTSKVVVVWLSSAVVASTLIAIVVSVVMWRRSTRRKLVTHITNENHHTTIVNNDNRQTIVNNCQHNYVDVASHSGVMDIEELLAACDDSSTMSVNDHSVRGPFHEPHDVNECINGHYIEWAS